MSRFYRKLASTVLIPLFNLNICAKNKQRDVHEDELNPPQHVNKVSPMPSRPIFVMSRELTSDYRLETDVQTMDVNGEEAFGGSDSKEKEIPTYTWQELAIWFDYFFLWLFGVVLVVITTVILALLYVDY